MKIKRFIFWVAFLGIGTTQTFTGFAQNSDGAGGDTETTTNGTGGNEAKKGIEHVWRSSQLDKETPTNAREARNKRRDAGTLSGGLPAGSKRVGCVCMDYEEKQQTGGGACGGHGGVRFWLYVLENGDTVRLSTWRDKEHPDSLGDGDLWKLSAYQRFLKKVEKKRDELGALQGYPVTNGAAGIGKGDTVVVVMPQSVGADGMNGKLEMLYFSLSLLAASGSAYIIKKMNKK